MKHPSSLDLEAFACGEAIPSVEGHVAECASCRAFLERLRGALSAGPSRSRAAEVVARAAARVEKAGDQATPNDASPALERPARSSTARDAARRTWFLRGSSVAIPLAVAAALLLFFRSPPPRSDVATTSSAVSSTREPIALATPSPEPETTFKGPLQVAVIRERAGQQSRFSGRVEVKPGDRLRVEVALDREQAILAAIMGDDASWLELMSEGVRPPGTFFSERSARVDGSPIRGTVLVGSPDAVRHARSTKRFEGVAAVRVELEGTP